MTELRKDPITGRWVIIKAQQQEPGLNLNPVDHAVDEKDCPFCEGHEDRTSGEIYSIRPESTEPNAPGWHVRCIPNINPVLTGNNDLGRRGVGLFDMMNNVGVHEVIIENPHHRSDFHDYEPIQMKRVLMAYRQRIVELKKNERHKYVLVFKNHGKRAGSLRISHAHSQVIATPVVPIRLKMELNGTRKYFQMKERCIFCDLIRQELKDDVRVIEKNETFLSLIPFASRFPYECAILPKRHMAYYENIQEKELDDLSDIFQRTFRRLHQVLNDSPYNCVLHDSPNTVPKKGAWKTIQRDYHWHFEIIPRTLRTAGFEWGTGFHINPVAPEKAAQDLKAIDLSG